MLVPTSKKKGAFFSKKRGSKGSRGSKSLLTLPGQGLPSSPQINEPGFLRLMKDLEKTQNGFSKIRKLCDALFIEGSNDNPAQVFEKLYLEPCMEKQKIYDEAKNCIDGHHNKNSDDIKTKLEKKLETSVGVAQKKIICKAIKHGRAHTFGGDVGQTIDELTKLKMNDNTSSETANSNFLKARRELTLLIKELITKRDDAYNKVKKTARSILDGVNAEWIEEETRIMCSPVVQAARSGNSMHLKQLLFSELDLASLRRRRTGSPIAATLHVDQTVCNSPRMEKACRTPSQRYERNKALLVACSSGHTDIVKAMIQANADINTSNKLKHTPLFCSAQRGHIKIVKELLKAKADFNLKNTAGKIAEDYAKEGSECMRVLLLARSPIMRAASTGIIEDVRKIIKKHPINTFENGRTPLLAATRVGDLNAIKILIALKADIEIVEASQKNSLMYAAEQGRVDIVKFILQSKANPHALDKNRKNAVHRAASEGHASVVQLLAKANGNLNAIDSSGKSIMATACRKGHVGVAEVLIEFKVNVEDRTTSGETAMMHAARNGNANVVEMLIRHKANLETRIEHASEASVLCGRFRSSTLMVLNQMDNTLNKPQAAQKLSGSADNTDTPLIHAARNGQLTVVKVLVEGNADLEAKGGREYDKLKKKWFKVKKTAIICATEGAHKDVVRYLAEAKANLDAQGVRGKTALHRAYERGKSSMMELLVDLNADPNSKDINKRTVLTQASDDGELHFVRCILKIKADIHGTDGYGETPLIVATRRGYASVVQCLLEGKSNIEDQDYISKSTPLALAAHEGHCDTVKVLLAAKAALDGKDNIEQKTALIKAAIIGSPRIVADLLEARADPNDADDDEQTAIFKGAKTGKISIIKALIDSKAEINLQDYEERTPLMEAVSAGYLNIVKYLMDANADINIENDDGNTAIMIAREKKLNKIVKYLAQS